MDLVCVTKILCSKNSHHKGHKGHKENDIDVFVFLFLSEVTKSFIISFVISVFLVVRFFLLNYFITLSAAPVTLRPATVTEQVLSFPR